MSTADVALAPGPDEAAALPEPGRAPGAFGRFFRSELWLIFGRRRNWAGGLVLASVPLLIAVVVKVSGSGGGDTFVFAEITHNGLFVALAALTVELPFFLPIAVSAIAGDAVAGEANLGTLRYLLVTPVDRARLVLVKLGGITLFTLAATVLIAVVGAAAGLALFGGGTFTTLSGTSLGFAAGLGRLALVCGYLTLCLTGLGAVGLFISTLTEQPIGAGITLLALTVVSQILDQLSQVAAIHPYLPTHFWLDYAEVLRDPLDVGALGPGAASALAYVAIFTAAAWARFSTADVSA
ncbi:ABC transporter permease [Isoptericola sp. b441]|uniref:ABC transporter permease n=1 Tax=Actinotalea lenta TaxID=3064654 RepID=A0ABT9D8R6_9CELL|nr:MULTISPECIES: ABC transporter permease [unclassified Isoptericola]MDO8106945.1 ABC transporter permease [Isoptericola sp. b441]MDO8121345.1 ABC transporter permease [Isoptericola sp. b490]